MDFGKPMKVSLDGMFEKKEYIYTVYKEKNLTTAAEKLFVRLRDLSHSEDFYQVGIFLNDELIGIANEVDREEDSIELGYAILPDYHNQGYGTEMLNALIYQMHAEGFSKVVTGAFEENLSSIRVMEKCGMQRIEKTDEIEYRGKIHTCVYYVKRI